MYSYICENIVNKLCNIFQGKDTISDYAISFHYVKPSDIYKMDLFIYKIRLFGVRNIDDDGSINKEQENRLLLPDQNLNHSKVKCVLDFKCKELLDKGLPWYWKTWFYSQAIVWLLSNKKDSISLDEYVFSKHLGDLDKMEWLPQWGKIVW